MPAGRTERAVRRDLRRIAAEDRGGGLAELALALARQIDEGLAPQQLAQLSAQLHAVLLSLAKKQEPAAVLDPVDELARRRARRIGADAAADG